MKDSGKSSEVKKRQVKSFVSEDRPSKSVAKSKLTLSSVPNPKSLAWYVALNSKPLEKKISSISLIQWKCPPRVALNTSWHVAGGERSQELEVQKCRDITVREVVYDTLSAIPPSPLSSPHMGGENNDNTPIPIIPIEETEEVELDTTPETTCINSQPPDLPESATFNDKLLPDILRGMESGDLEVAAAVAATVAAVMESKEKIDTQLLIKLLTNPEMVKKLIDENGSGAKPENETTPIPETNRSLPLPSSTPANECGAIPSNFRPQAVNRSLSLPHTKAEREISKSTFKQGGTVVGTAPLRTSKPAYKSNPLSRSHSEVAPTKNLTIQPAHRHIHHFARVKQVSPLMPSTLWPDQEEITGLINKYLNGKTYVPPPNLSTSKPNMNVLKKMIHDYGAAPGIRPVAPLYASTSRPPYVQKMKNMVNEYGVVPDHGRSKHLSIPEHLSAGMIPPLGNLPTLPDALQSPVTSELPLFPRFPFPAPPMDLPNYDHVIKIHGENHKMEEHKLPKFIQPVIELQGPEGANNKSSFQMNPRYQKPCMYFNTAKGCWNGTNCPFQHVSEERRVGDSGVVEFPVAKRMKFG